MTETVKGVFTADVSGYTSAMSRMQKSTSSTTSGIMGGNKKNSGSMLKLGAVAGVATALVNKGMRLVADSVGGAVDRFDTLNKYPTVMRALGYSAGDTNKSIKMLNKGIDGLPTSLDEITRSAQDFAPLTGGATSGAKAALALNDAFLASGASVADASRGMTQYSQMLATGKVDLMSYRTLQETMPIALRKVANSFGYTGKSAEQDLFQALKKGKLTVDDLNKKFIELDKGQNGFAQLARKNSVGIKTSFANIKTSIVKGLANMLTAIDTGLAKAKLPGIAQMFNNMKTSINKAFDSINKIIVKAIPIIVDGFNKLVDFAKKNADWLKPLTLGIGTFIATFNGMQKVIGIVTKVGGAFKNFFSILSANPIVATIAIIAALTAGLVYFFTQTKSGKKLWSDLVNIFSGSTGAFIAVAGAVALVGGGLALLLKKIIKPAKPLDELGKHFGTTGQKAGKSAAQIAAVGVKAAGIGVGIGAAAAGFGVFAMGIAKMAKTGKSGLIALAALTASIVVLAVTFVLLKGPLTAAIPAMLSLSVTMLAAGTAALMIGGAIALAGVGIKSASQGVMILVQSFVLLGQNMTMIVPVMTQIGAGFAMMIVGFVTALATQIPLVAQSMLQMLLTIMQTINAYLPQLIIAGTNLIVNFLNGIAIAIPRIVEAATNVILNFLNSLTANVPKLIPAGVNFIVAILKGIAQNIPTLADAALNVVLKFLGWLTDNVGKLITAGVKFVLAIVKGVGDHLGEIANAALNLLQKFLNTLLKSLNRIIDMGVKFVESVVQGIGKRIGQMPGEGLKLINLFIKGVRDGLSGSRGAGNANANAVKGGVTGISLFGQGSAIIGSFLSGLKSKFEGVKSFVSGIAGWIKKHKGPISYDRKLLIPAGNSIMTGFNAGLSSQFLNVQKNVASMADKVAKQVATGLSDISANPIDDLNASMSPSLAVSRNMDENFSGSFDDSGLARMTRMIVQAIDEKDTDLILDGDSVVKKTSGRMDNELGNNVRLRSRLT